MDTYEETLLHEVEILRSRMIEVAMQSGSLCSDKTVAASQALDKIMVKLQKLQAIQRVLASPV